MRRWRLLVALAVLGAAVGMRRLRPLLARVPDLVQRPAARTAPSGRAAHPGRGRDQLGRARPRRRAAAVAPDRRRPEEAGHGVGGEWQRRHDHRLGGHRRARPAARRPGRAAVRQVLRAAGEQLGGRLGAAGPGAARDAAPAGPADHAEDQRPRQDRRRGPDRGKRPGPHAARRPADVAGAGDQRPEPGRPRDRRRQHRGARSVRAPGRPGRPDDDAAGRRWRGAVLPRRRLRPPLHRPRRPAAAG